eukprot:8970940-Alexandrium_andersonii.AAC.1
MHSRPESKSASASSKVKRASSLPSVSLSLEPSPRTLFHVRAPPCRSGQSQKLSQRGASCH